MATNEFIVRKGLIVNGSGSTVLDIQGSQGQLFSVTDDLTGTLFSVNDISGIPILSVDSDDTVTMGTFGENTLVVSGSRVGIGSANTTSRKLRISGGSEVPLLLDATQDYLLGFARAGSEEWWIRATTGGDLIVHENGVGDKVTFQAGGNVGIGTTSPGAKLDVNGGIDATTLNTGQGDNELYAMNQNVRTTDGVTFQQATIAGTNYKSYGSGETDITGLVAGSTFGTLIEGISAGHIVIGIRGNDTADSFSILSGNGNYTTDSTYDFKVFSVTNIGNATVGNNLTVSNDLFVNDYARIDALRVGTTSTDPGDGNLYVEGTSTLGAVAIHSSNYIKVGIGQGMRMYNQDNDNHGIFSQNSGGGGDDDIRINSYGAIYLNLDSNNNNGSGADFNIARHGGTGTLSDYLFKLDGESGRVGIGTTSPNDKLHVVGNLFIEDSSPEITLETGATHYNWQIAAQENVDAGLEFSVGSQDADASNDTFSPLMSIKNTGNVLIGRTSDVTSQKLQVNGFIDITDVTGTALRWYDGSTFRGGLGLDDWAVSGGAANDITLYGMRHLFFVAGGGNNKRMTIQSDGKVGIGTTSPSYKLDVGDGTVNTSIRIHAGVNGSASLRLKNDAQDWDVNTQTTDTFAIYNQTSGTQPFSILTNGNVGIGTASPSHMLDITTSRSGNGQGSTIRINRPDNSSYENAINWATNGTNKWFLGSDNDSTENFYLYNWAAGAFALTVQGSNNNVGIGTTSPGTKLEVNGTSKFNNLLTVVDDIYPETDYTSNIGAINKKFLTLNVAELFVETLVASERRSTVGGRFNVGISTQLSQSLASSASTIIVENNNLNNGDIIQLEGGITPQVEFMKVTSGATNVAGDGYSYTVSRNLDGTGANDWDAGAGVFNTGQTDNGYIDLYAINSLTSGVSTAGPAITFMQRTGSAYQDVDIRAGVGNLKGWYGYGADIFGFAAGDYKAQNITVDPTNGLRIRDIDTIQLQAEAGSLSIGDSFLFDSANGKLFVSGSNIDLVSPSFFLGNSSQFISGSNGNLRIESTNFTVAQNGDVSLTGNISAASGDIGGFTIGNNTLSTTNFTIGDSTQTFAIAAGSSNQFTVTHAGVLTATGATISGDITINNPGDINISGLNNDSGFTDDTAANAAQGTANTAVTNAATAQGTANTAVSNAATAQSTANTAVTNAATAQGTANTAVSNAATAQAAIDTMETQVVLSNEGMSLKAINDAGNAALNGQNVATFGTTTKFFDGVADADANVKLQLQATGIKLFGDTIYQKAELDSSGLTIFDDQSSVAVDVANFSNTARIGVETAQHVLINTAGFTVKDNTATLASFGTDITLGEVGSSKRNVFIDADSGVTIRNNTTALANFGTDITLGQTSGTNRNVFIDADSGVQIRRGTQVSASFGGTSAHIGPTAGRHVLLDSDSFDVKNNTATLASFGSTTTIGRVDEEGEFAVRIDGSTVDIVTLDDLNSPDLLYTKASFGTTTTIGSASEAHVEVQSSGVKVYSSSNSFTNINSSGFDVTRGGTSNAFFGASTRIGPAAGKHVDITSTGVFVSTDASTGVAKFGSDMRVGLDAADKTALRVDISGNLTIGTSGTTNFTAAANGNVTLTGDLTATNITATTAGNIAGWSIGSNTLSSGNVNLSNASNQKGLFINAASGPNILQVGDFGTVTPSSTTLAFSNGSTTASSGIFATFFPYSIGFSSTFTGSRTATITRGISTSINTGDLINISQPVSFQYLLQDGSIDSVATLATIKVELIESSTVYATKTIQRSSIFPSSTVVNLQHTWTGGNLGQDDMEVKITYTSNYNRDSNPGGFTEVFLTGLVGSKDIPQVNITKDQVLFYQSPDSKLEWTPSGLEIRGGESTFGNINAQGINMVESGSIALDAGNISIFNGGIDVGGANSHVFISENDFVDPEGYKLFMDSDNSEMILMNKAFIGTISMIVDGDGGQPEFAIRRTTNNIEVFRIDNNGNVTIPDGNLIVASGHGIDFSATGEGSGMSSELLDDYEEGTFTPTITAGATLNTAHANNYGKYTKIGNVVHCSGRLQTTSVTNRSSSTNVTIGGFPFAVDTPLTTNGTGVIAGSIGFATGFSTAAPTTFQIRNNQTDAFLYYQNSSLTFSNTKGTHFSSTNNSIVFQITYHTA